jgi:hypothetical protein
MANELLALAGDIGLYRSLDRGVSWAEIPHPNTNVLGFWCFGGGTWLYVRTDTSSNSGFVSTDLSSWAPITLPAVKYWIKLHFALGAFYLFASTDNYYRSVDGITWTTHVGPFSYQIRILLANSDNTLFMLEDSTLTTTNIYKTTDGLTWVLAGTHTGASKKNMHWTGGGLSIYRGSSLDKSVDGSAWTTTATTASKAVYVADDVIGFIYSSSTADAAYFIGDSAVSNTTTVAATVSLCAGVADGRIFIGRVTAGYANFDYSDDGVTWLSTAPIINLSMKGIYVGAVMAPEILSDLFTVGDFSSAAITQFAQALSGVGLGSISEGTLRVGAYYFDGLQLSSFIASTQAVSAYFGGQLALGTDLSGIAVIDGARIILSEPIQYGVNAASGALTRYQGFGFTHYARSGQELYGAKADGVYRIRGGDDDGVAIAATIDFGESLLDTARLKSINALYFGADTDGAMYVRLRADGIEHTYPVVPKGGNARATPGRGMEGRAWQVLLEVEDATHLDLDMVEIRLGASARRLKGRT